MNILFPSIRTDTFKKFNQVALDDTLYRKCTRIDGGEFRLYETPSGDRYPSITTILGHEKDPYLIEWRNKVGDEEADAVSRRATIRGNALHEMCEKYTLNTLANSISSYNFMRVADFKRVKTILDDHVDNIRAVELPMFSDYLKAAGTIDLIADYDGELSIIDYKTSKERKHASDIPSYFKQVSAYAQMMNEMFGLNIKKAVIIMIVLEDNPITFEVDCTEYLPLFKKDRFKFYKKTGV